MKALLTEDQLAERIGVKVGAVRMWRRRGLGPAHIVIGRHTIRYREEDVAAYEAARVTGGYVSPDAAYVMTRAAAAFEKVATWKIAAPARDMLLGLRAELLAIVE